MVPIISDPTASWTVSGHWEGHLLVGRYGPSHMVTMVERHSRYLLVLRRLAATTRTVVAALMAAFQQLPPPCADPSPGTGMWK
jgi:IS30 family transposase